MADNESSFFSRWSRRKAVARTGELPPEPVAKPLPETAETQASSALQPAPTAPAAAEVPATATATTTTTVAETRPPPPTMADVALLTRDSDYSRFVASDVSPEVKNAALKQLFTDPHFNVMDGLDTYIDDYGKPDPLPPGMLRQMVQSQLLGLFDDEEKDDEKKDDEKSDAVALDAVEPATAEDLAPPPVADTTPALVCPASPALPAPDEDPDLQLQPDDGARRPGAEPGAGAHVGRPH